MTITTYSSVRLPNGVDMSFAHSGDASNPVILLLHGYPSSSNQFRNLIPALADRYHVVAPDLPGFGHTKYPSNYVHSFENFAKSIGLFLDARKITSFAVYIFDYGAPTALRLALDRPEAVKAIITQNGNAYEEGLGAWWDPLRSYWATEKGSTEYASIRETIRKSAFTLEAVKDQYIDGTPRPLLDHIDPNAYALDYFLALSDEDRQEVQLDLFYDYQTNLSLYPAFQEFFRKYKPPTLAVWGRNDPIFIPPGAQLYTRDNADTKVALLDGGHFLLETHFEDVAELIREFLASIPRWSGVGKK
ncbi:Uncharacterized hydrolase [Saitozyma sp. JCM 24511]|nr:Uncharacterized hydrolase [Saitozyma sp. JCM 24511]